MRPKIDIDKLKHLPTAEDMFVEEYGAKGTVSRDEFDAKSRAWYYAEVLKNARKSAGITQQQLADKIGKKREYVAMLEKGETDMAALYIHHDFRGCRVEIRFDVLKYYLRSLSFP